ncbi:uncharacterized protein IL334_006143 [Kwoniella shivajii]|uniref:Integrase catalytic domain-containing protein n=1 Tax=Kwoniella shivajii TaxID=564305 RepID=A0ABZ1D546_9TREE|nr:hypothetical protein IL334_006143 [Kwoniella shivajii]
MGSGLEGQKGVHSGLKELGVKVTQKRVRDALKVFYNRPGKERRAIIRRVYHVPFINSLWHIDGHHKLGPWGIVIHGAIDGFSWRIMYIFVADNNRASTVISAFLRATEKYGWPSRVRADLGKENWEVKAQMEKVRGLNRGSFIQGPSTHNQRIERLWVDVQQWSTARYRQQFIYYEEQGYRCRDDPLEMWALHFVYIPTLRKALEFFVERWNNHGISTEKNSTPVQLWHRNLRAAEKIQLSPIQHVDPLTGYLEDHYDDPDAAKRFEDYGVDHFKGRSGHQLNDNDPHKKTPAILSSLPEDVRAMLESLEFQQRIEEVAGDDRWTWPPPADFGLERYLTVVQEVNRIVRQEFPALYS